MLEIRTNCENCNKNLPNDSHSAMICSYECTFCKNCVDGVLFNVCPNCGGGFEKRPTRPKEDLAKNPVKADNIFKPLEENKFLNKNINIEPRKR
jgi:hypothetical protein